MNNFEFEHNGKKLWYSRAVAVVGLIFAHDYIWDWYVLANKRGKNTPDFQGCWSLPCGYLDFNETCEEAIIREIFEETGLKIPDDNYLNLIGIDSIPEGRQNVTIRFKCSLMDDITTLKLTNKNADEGEVDEARWINLREAGSFNWAFNHLQLVSTYWNEPPEAPKKINK